MNVEFWNSRYAENESVYGLEPNVYFKLFIDTNKPGSLLLPADGEGRNAIYAASKGWQVDAFDFSTTAIKKAKHLANEKDVEFTYTESSLEEFSTPKKYDAIALIYVHMASDLRKSFHQKMIEYLKPEGYLILEAFSNEQIRYQSGGPKNSQLLYTTHMLQNDFKELHIISCKQIELDLMEGEFHKGKASVIQLLAQKGPHNKGF